MLGIGLVALAAGLWGTVGVASRLMSSTGLDPAVVGLVRTLLGAASLLAVAMVLSAPRNGKVPLALLVMFGLAGAVFQTCLFAAFSRVGVTVTVVVTVCAPIVLVQLGDALWARRLPEASVAVAMGVAMVGVLLATFGYRTMDTGASVDARGALLLVGASGAFAVVAMSARAMARRLHPLWASGLGLAATAAVLAAVLAAVWEVDDDGIAAVGALPAWDLAILAYTGVAATGGAYLAFVSGMHLSRTASVGLAATLIEPGVAALLAALLLRERLALPQVVGCGLVLLAMVCLALAERRAGRSQPA